MKIKIPQLEVIVWLDAAKREGNIKKVLEEKQDLLVKCVNIGYVIKEDEEVVCLLHHYDNTNEIWYTAIPKSQIIRREIYKKVRK